MREPFLRYVKNSLGSNFLLIACGLPGTWKTETTEEVSKITGYPLLRTDLIRLEVLRNEDVFDEKVAGNMNKRALVYEEMFRRAEDKLRTAGGVILDATFVTRALRRQAAATAARHGRRFIILQTDCPPEVSIARILARSREEYVSNALTEQAYRNNQKRFEPVDLADLKRHFPALPVTHLVVDTAGDPPERWYITRVTEK